MCVCAGGDPQITSKNYVLLWDCFCFPGPDLGHTGGGGGGGRGCDVTTWTFKELPGVRPGEFFENLEKHNQKVSVVYFFHIKQILKSKKSKIFRKKSARKKTCPIGCSWSQKRQQREFIELFHIKQFLKSKKSKICHTKKTHEKKTVL